MFVEPAIRVERGCVNPKCAFASLLVCSSSLSAAGIADLRATITLQRTGRTHIHSGQTFDHRSFRKDR